MNPEPQDSEDAALISDLRTLQGSWHSLVQMSKTILNQVPPSPLGTSFVHIVKGHSLPSQELCHQCSVLFRLPPQWEFMRNHIGLFLCKALACSKTSGKQGPCSYHNTSDGRTSCSPRPPNLSKKHVNRIYIWTPN